MTNIIISSSTKRETLLLFSGIKLFDAAQKNLGQKKKFLLVKTAARPQNSACGEKKNAVSNTRSQVHVHVKLNLSTAIAPKRVANCGP